MLELWQYVPQGVDQREVRRAVAVRDAASDQHSGVLERLDELARDPRLADSGVPDERHEAAAALRLRDVECESKRPDLVVSPDERRVECARDPRCIRLDTQE